MMKQDSIATDTKQYQQGQRAYRGGKSIDSCPRAKGDGRTRWFAGWINAGLNDKLGLIFEIHGVGSL